jgi:hypothetical protein
VRLDLVRHGYLTIKQNLGSYVVVPGTMIQKNAVLHPDIAKIRT